jgi:hypothetical protein
MISLKGNTSMSVKLLPPKPPKGPKPAGAPKAAPHGKAPGPAPKGKPGQGVPPKPLPLPHS